MKKTDLFPTPLWHDNLTGIDNGALASYINDKYAATNGVTRSGHSDTEKSKHSNWISDPITDFSKYPELVKLLDMSYARALQMYAEFNPKPTSKLILGRLWFNVNPTGTSVAPHQHPSNTIVAVYYVDAEGDSAKLRFMNPDKAVSWMYLPNLFGERTKYTDPLHEHQPKTGDLLLFPGTIPHYVDSNQTDSNRLSIAINFSTIQTS